VSDEPTKEELYTRATELEVEGRSGMNKDELAAAVEDAEGSQGGIAADVSTPVVDEGDSGPAATSENVAGETATTGPDDASAEDASAAEVIEAQSTTTEE
jgi:hypothetical protein